MFLNILAFLVVCHILITWIRAIQRGVRARRQMNNAKWRFQQIPVFGLSSEIKTNSSWSMGSKKDMHWPLVSILVPAWNEKGTIEKCIAALQKLDYQNWNALILAGGEDGTYEAALNWAEGDTHFRVFEREPEPKNAAINRGVGEASGEIVVILDADSIVEPGWLSALVEPLIGGASASFGMHYPAKWTWISTEEHMEVLEAYHILGTALGQGCSSIAIRREAFEKIGPLPTEAFSWEDADIGFRLAKAAEKIAFVPSAKLINERPATFLDYWKTAIRVHRAHLALLWHWRRLIQQKPKWIFFQSYFHIFSLVLFAGLLLSAFLALMVPSSAKVLLNIIALVFIWMIARRAALSGEISAYTGKIKWLIHAWNAPVLMLVQLITSNYALFTLWRPVPFDYKGRRGPRIEAQNQQSNQMT